MMRIALALLVLGLCAGIASGDSSNLEHGVFIAHAPPGVVYTSGTIARCDSTLSRPVLILR
jgi:hypothetical protein